MYDNEKSNRAKKINELMYLTRSNKKKKSEKNKLFN